MRSLALAQAWREQGGSVRFSGRCDGAEVEARIRQAGFPFSLIQRIHPDPSDLTGTIGRLWELKGDGPMAPWLAVDGYHFDEGYIAGVQAAGFRTLLVDDSPRLMKYQAEAILNPNLHAEGWRYPSEPETLHLLGQSFALLRAEFSSWRGWKRHTPDRARKLLVTMGGGDLFHVTAKVLRALERLSGADLELTVLVGGLNPHLHELEQLAQEMHFPVQIRVNAADMPGLIAEAELAISAAGSTCWEMAYLGLPALLLTLAANQRVVAEGLAASGAAMDLGWHDQISEAEIAKNVHQLMADRAVRAKMAAAGPQLVDGRGAARAALILQAVDTRCIPLEAVQVRLARLEDAAAIWRLANQTEVRRNSFHPEPIPLDTHMDWYKRKLESPECQIWVLEVAGMVVAQVRYDLVEPQVAEIGFMVTTAMQGKGLGKLSLQATTPLACKAMGLLKIRGIVMIHNDPSSASFRKTGFQEIGIQTIQGRECRVFEKACAQI